MNNLQSNLERECVETYRYLNLGRHLMKALNSLNPLVGSKGDLDL